MNLKVNIQLPVEREESRGTFLTDSNISLEYTSLINITSIELLAGKKERRGKFLIIFDCSYSMFLKFKKSDFN